MKSLRRVARPLIVYTLVNNFSSNLAQPFISFANAASGIIGEQLGLISSSSSVLPAIVQFFLSYIKSSGKKLVVFGTLATGVFWIILSFVPFGAIFTGLYVVLNASTGISLFGWYLIMDKASYSSRGRTLAQYSFYSNLGSLVATLVTGFIVGNNSSMIRLFFIATGILTLLDGIVAAKFDIDSEYIRKPIGNISRELKSYLLLTFIFSMVWALAWPIFPMAQVYIFHMDFLEIAIINVISIASTLLLQYKIGYLVDKNRKLMMFTGSLALATFPLVYAFSTNIYEIYLSSIMSGFTNSVSSTAYLSYLYDSSSDTRKSVGIYNTVQGLGYLIGSSIGSIAGEDLFFLFGNFGIKESLTIVAMLRIVVSFWFLKLPEPKTFKPKIGMR